jgi:predicted DNA-binding protein (UPF0251 family)
MRGPYRRRRIHLPPQFLRFKPTDAPRRSVGVIELSVDEFEAVRLADYEGQEHLEASEKMGISRSTFTRVVDKARCKIAKALIEGKELVIEGGHVQFVNALYRCRDCGDVKPGPMGEDADICPECGSRNIEDLTGRCTGRRRCGKRR